MTDYTGKCGTCKHFEWERSRKSGWCHAYTYGEDVAHDPKHPNPKYPASKVGCKWYVRKEDAE